MYIGFALLLGTVTDYLVNDSPTHTETANAYYSAAGMAMLTVLSSMCVHLYSTTGYKIEMFIRIICSTVIYQKVQSYPRGCGQVCYYMYITGYFCCDFNLASDKKSKFKPKNFDYANISRYTCMVYVSIYEY